MRAILWLSANDDPYVSGYWASESKDNGKSWFFRGDIGAKPRSWWRIYARKNNYILREKGW